MINKKYFPYVSCSLLKKLILSKKNAPKGLLKTWSRATMVIPDMIGHTLLLHNGKKHFPLYIKDTFVGHKLGEFISTRKFKRHKRQGPRKVQKRDIVKEEYE